MASNLVAYAKNELQIAGLLKDNPDAEYDGMLGESILEMVSIFARQGHSGNSASATISLLENLLRFRPITPLTYGPEEWNDVSAFCSGRPHWQNKRKSTTFSDDGGLTHYDLDDK